MTNLSHDKAAAWKKKKIKISRLSSISEKQCHCGSVMSVREEQDDSPMGSIHAILGLNQTTIPKQLSSAYFPDEETEDQGDGLNKRYKRSLV